MKAISMKEKFSVIKLFLGGDSYDEIAQQVGIGKGSVVNIIEDFRSGVLLVPPGITGYVDELRKLAVDLKKNHTTVSQVMSYQKLEARITAKGVSGEKIGQWLDVVEGIATSAVSNNQFVQAALELAETTSASGKSYTSVVKDCYEKQATNKKLDVEIKKKKKEIAALNQEHETRLRKYTNELKTITDAAETAQVMFEKQTEELMSQKNLTFNEINITSAILNTELGKIELSQENIQKISKQISEAGSLTVYIKNLEGEKQKLKAFLKN